MEIDRNSWKQTEIDGNRWKQIDIDGNKKLSRNRWIRKQIEMD